LYFRIRLARICDLCLCFCKLQSCLQLRSDGKGVEREAREERVGLWHWPANVTVHSNNNFPPFRWKRTLRPAVWCLKAKQRLSSRYLLKKLQRHLKEETNRWFMELERECRWRWDCCSVLLSHWRYYLERNIYQLGCALLLNRHRWRRKNHLSIGKLSSK
uniref:Uncharacterized protein n=1 Tax=Parascaris univalens TaxID=6257 RepID=A0A915BBS7_PARUN